MDWSYPPAPGAARRPASVGASLVLAFVGAAFLALAAAFLALFIAAFADDGHYQAGGLIFAAPNVVVANLLVAGGLRLRLDHHDVAQFLKITSPLLIPPVLAAALAWTPAARRWTAGRSRRGVPAVHR